MARKKNVPETEIVYAPIAEQAITETLETNYMPYAMSVIISRAIPEIDGLKPAHRKLLYTMYKMGLLNVKTHLPSQVSGGQQQRCAIARAVIHTPKLLFADEPTGALNKRNTIQVLDILTDLNKNGQSIVMVTHDSRAAIRATRLLYIEDGKVIEIVGTTLSEDAWSEIETLAESVRREQYLF